MKNDRKCPSILYIAALHCRCGVFFFLGGGIYNFMSQPPQGMVVQSSSWWISKLVLVWLLSCCNVGISCGLKARDLIMEIVSLQKEVSHLEQHVLSLYRKVFNQRLSTHHQNGSSDFSSSLQSSPSSYHVSRFKAEQRLETQVPQQLLLCPPSASSPQHHCHDDASIVVPTTQGFKRPHSAIISAADQSKTQQVSPFLNTSFYCIDKGQPLQAGGVKPVHVYSSSSSPVSFLSFYCPIFWSY